MELREAAPPDADAVLEVHRAAIEELGPEGYDDEEVAAWAAGRSADDYEFDDPDRYFVVAEVDGEIRGFGILTLTAREHLTVDVDAEVTGVYVHPDVARRGVGTALLEHLERRARERGATSLGLWASLNAVPFYERRGYERVAEHGHEFAEGVNGRVIEMRTDL